MADDACNSPISLSLAKIMKVELPVSAAWREFDSPRVQFKNIPFTMGCFCFS
jgi:hypothetical protein